MPGLNATLNDALLPGPIVVDVESPLTLKPAPVTLICENVNVALPEFVKRDALRICASNRHVAKC